jgi:hypothetical protein
MIFSSSSSRRVISSRISSTSSSSASNTGNSKLGDGVGSLCSMGLINLHNDFGYKRDFRIQTKQIIMQMKRLILFLFLGFYVIINFMQKAKRENNWKNKHLT